MEIVHQTNIGFIYDVCQVIICKTSKRESWINSYVLNGHEEDIEIIDNVLNQFSVVDRCWSLLTIFHPKKGRLLTKLFVEFIRNLSGECTLESFLEYITDKELLKTKISDWFFGDANASDSECFNQLHNMKNIDDTIRISLYEFYTVREKYVIHMQNTLHGLFGEMTTFYDGYFGALSVCQKEFDYSKFKQDGEIFSPNPIWGNKIQKCVVTFSIINRYIILRDEFQSQSNGWILLGIDYDKEVKEIEKKVDLIGFGNAFGDIIRMKILREIHLNGEKTLTDLSKKFNLVNAVMLYHLDILRNERLLGQRHEGRRVYYWLNYNRLKDAIFTINSQFGGELIETVEKTGNDYDE